MITVYVSIGNSDDKLSQLAWSAFANDLMEAVLAEAEQVHGVWYSQPSEPYQNACVCFEIDEGEPATLLKAALAQLAARYQQDSIAWAPATTEFIAGTPA